MIQKKICMVGAFATGKTSLVGRFVRSKFSDKYHTTVGVKIDRKQVAVDGTDVNLMLWDLAGKDEFQELRTNYLRGSSGLIYVVDGTRRDTLTVAHEMQQIAHGALGDVPSVVAINKADLRDDWEITEDDIKTASEQGRHVMITSAKSGDGVEEAFSWLASQILP
jgi:small GTP-binding protein